MSAYLHHTPASDTVEIRRDLRAPIADWSTEPLRFPWFLPSAPRRVERPNRWRRLLTSPAADHLRAAARSTFWPLVCGSGVVLALLVIAYLQGIAPSVPIR